jgi:uncharacterized membrane protein YdfJ with MMPL/SSD domain
MPQLSRFLLGHKLAVVAAWLLVLVAGVGAAGAVSTRLSQEFSFPGEEGYEANVAILRSYGTGGPGNPLVPVVTLPAGVTVDSLGVRAALARAFGAIAEKLVVSPATARTHVSRAMVKLGARDRAQLVVLAYQSGLVAPGRPAG